MLHLLDLVYAVCTWKPERLEQIVDIPVPQIEEEIAKVDRFLHLCETASGTFTSRKSRCFRHELVWNRPFDPYLCSESDVLVRAQFDAHARLFSVVLSLTFMSIDNPHRLKCAISLLKSLAQVSTS